mmetsp:Transcript_3562/g.8509  ORF Transcript_3562/g.8509 Transcript_3562/m.8509 type:complete len:220 (-) Transcript_3562:240-899(-)
MWDFCGSSLGNRQNVFSQFLGIHSGVTSLNGNASAGVDRHVGRTQGLLNGKGQSGLTRHVDRHRKLLGLDKALAQGLAHHGQNAVVCQKHVVLGQQLAFLFIRRVLFPQGIQCQYLFDASHVVREFLNHFLAVGLGFVLDNETNLGLFGIVVVVVVVVIAVVAGFVGELVKGVGDQELGRFWLALAGSSQQRELDLNGTIVSEQDELIGSAIQFLLVVL